MNYLSLAVTLIALSAVLPIVGFGRLLYRAQRSLSKANALVNERASAAPTFDDFNAENDDIRKPFLRERNDLAWDISFVGLGLAAGAAASIWSLFT